MSAKPVVDALEREAALDPARSFIVQAPAGSGKTGLLIQRYLRLLAVVDRPEEILAITFTKKAAAEMRRRVLGALDSARDERSPEKEHERKTWELAREALARDGARGWRLAENAARLRIQTIDSLCAALARQMPVLSRLGAPPEIVEDARELYHEAAVRTLGLIESGGPAAEHVARLLRHLDGDWTAARELFERMLGRRDQWIRRVAGLKLGARERERLQESFVRERARLMRRVRALLPAALGSELTRLVRLPRLPAADESGAGDWLALVEIVLTKGDSRFRTKVNKNQGFPPETAADKRRKGEMERLLKQLAEIEGLADALHAVRRMPPARFSEAQWEVLGSVVELLPLSVAELVVVFGERGEIDFSGIAQGAVTALGTPEQPTDLLLALDVKLHHLLVDEFQDTSLGQWDLLTRLVAGWSPGDGRTVFLVGDPMQSIYRFREAQVALFLRAWNEGLGDVGLVPAKLATNFRSQEGLVAWFNRECPKILAQSEDSDEGAVAYAQSSSHHLPEPGNAVEWHALVGTDIDAARAREAKAVVRITAEALAADPEGDVAILVRNRTHLDHIVPALKGAKIAFRAVDIEPLRGRQVIQDLLALARALSHPADRVSWLALLRAPWCALSLADLLALTGGALRPEGARQTVWELLEDRERLEALSEEGCHRATRVRERLAPFVTRRLRASLQEHVESSWLALGGPACVERASDLEDAQTFFDQLATLEEAGSLADPAALEEHLGELYAAPDLSKASRVQLMTIHKAKGLEFSTVIVPGLDRRPRASEYPLFAWKARADGSIMMAPVRRTGEKSEPAYDYLRSLERASDGHELERLFYVAATRACKRLHLLGYARAQSERDPPQVNTPPWNSLLAKAWSAAHPHFLAAAAAGPLPPTRVEEEEADRGLLRTLTERAFSIAVPGPAVAALPARRDSGTIEFSWAGETARHVGTITHRWLQRIAGDGLERWDGARVEGLEPAIRRALARSAVPPEDLGTATRKVVRALKQAITEERGRWILGPHPEARSEYRLRVAGPDGVRGAVIDRLFRASNGALWIVDYKTSTHEGADIEGFLDRERERYAGQLQGYANALADRGPVRLGLYFPLLPGWREWSP